MHKKLFFIILGFVLFFIFSGKILADSATLSWNPNIESDLAGYKIYYGTSSRTADCPPGGYPQKADAGKTVTPEKPSYEIKNLSDGRTYYFSVSSYDSTGNESCFSPEISKTFPATKISWYKSLGQFFGKLLNSLTRFFK